MMYQLLVIWASTRLGAESSTGSIGQEYSEMWLTITDSARFVKGALADGTGKEQK